MKTSEVFRRIRLHLCDEWTPDTQSHRRYICYAAHYLYLISAIGDRDRTRIKRLIRGHLDGCATLEHWLHQNHNISCARSVRYNKKIMATRKAWLTHLIEHYSHKGD